MKLSNKEVLEVERVLKLHSDFMGVYNEGRCLKRMDTLSFNYGYKGSMSQRIDGLLNDYYETINVKNLKKAIERLKQHQKAEDLLADIRNKLSPASHLICLVRDYFSGVKTAVEFENLHEHIKQAIPKAEESIEYVRKLKL